jgi:hypothetical protein
VIRGSAKTSDQMMGVAAVVHSRGAEVLEVAQHDLLVPVRIALAPLAEHRRGLARSLHQPLAPGVGRIAGAAHLGGDVLRGRRTALQAAGGGCHAGALRGHGGQRRGAGERGPRRAGASLVDRCQQLGGGVVRDEDRGVLVGLGERRWGASRQLEEPGQQRSAGQQRSRWWPRSQSVGHA